MTLDAVAPLRDIVAEAGKAVRFAVEPGSEREAKSLRFEWSLDGLPLDAGGPEIEFSTGDLAPGTHHVSVRLFDGESEATLSWKLQVSEGGLENRPPIILQALPPGGVSVGKGEVFDLAVVATDVDAGDEIEYSWLIDGVPALSSGTGLRIESSTLQPGEHVVRVVVGDGFEHSGETPAEHTWSVLIGEGKDAARPYLTGAWPLGSFRLRPPSVVRFEVEAARTPGGEEPVFRWEVNGRVQASRDPVFELDTSSDEGFLPPGAYRITCAIDEARTRDDLESASIGWTMYLDLGPSSFEPERGGGTDNSPPFAESIYPPGPLRLSSGESESFRVEARDPDGDVLSYQWLVNGVLQITDGPVLTYTAPPSVTGEAFKMEVFASDGRFRPGDEEFFAGPRLGVWEFEVDSALAQALTLTAGSIVLDNGAAGASASGSWSLSSASGYYGADSVYSRTAGATYAYNLQVPVAGTYDALLWWTSLTSRSGVVPVAVTHKSGTTTVRVDQRVNGGRWNKLGTFDFSGAAKVVITSQAGDLSTCADAVCLSPVAATSPPPAQDPGVEFVIDDGTAGTSSQGTWSPSSAPNPYGGRSLYAKGSGSNTFSRPLAAPGTYDVFAWWTEWTSRDPAVPYAVLYADGTATVKVDQRQGGGKWNLLGRYAFGPRVEVKVTVPGSPSVCADAVRFVPAAGGSPLPAPGEIVLDNGGPGTSASGTWAPSSAPNPYGGSSLYARSSGFYAYQAALPSAGTYGVYVWYTQWPSRESAVPYEVRHGSGTTTIKVDQRSDGGQWKLLGDFGFGSTANVTVRVVDADTVCADAVRLVPRSGSPPPSSGLTLAWDAPTKNADGSSLADLVGYRVYAASGGGAMTLIADVGLRTECNVTSLAPGKYTFAATAYDSLGNESRFSSTLVALVP